MPPKPLPDDDSVAEPALEADPGAPIEDSGDGPAFYVLTAVIGLCLLIAVPLLRGGYALMRPLRMPKWVRVPRARKPLWLEPASLD